MVMQQQQQSLSWEQQIQLLLGGDIKRFNFGPSQQPQPTMVAAPVIPHSAPAHSVAVSSASSAASGAGIRKLSNPPPGLQKSVAPPVLPVHTAPSSSSSSSRYSSSVSGVAATHPPHPMQDGSVEAALAQLGLLGSFPDLASSSMTSSLGMHAATTTAAAVAPPRFVGGGSSNGHSSWGNSGPSPSSVHHHPSSAAAPFQPIQNGYGSTVQPAAAVIRVSGANTQAPTRKAVGGVNIRL